MKWIDKPKLAFEQMEVIRDDKVIGWQVGQHSWLPATVGFDSHADFMKFISNTPKNILGFEFDNINIIEAVSTATQCSTTFTFDHARIL
jgi:hypothetical protein